MSSGETDHTDVCSGSSAAAAEQVAMPALVPVVLKAGDDLGMVIRQVRYLQLLWHAQVFYVLCALPLQL